MTDTLVSVNVGMPRDVEWHGRVVHTGIWKSPAAGPVMARRLNLDGDGQGDLGGHGGEQRAVFVYQLDSHRYWQQYLNRGDFHGRHLRRESHRSRGCRTPRYASETAFASGRPSSR